MLLPLIGRTTSHPHQAGGTRGFVQTQPADWRSTPHRQFSFTQAASGPGLAGCDATWPPPRHASPKLSPQPLPAAPEAPHKHPPLQALHLWPHNTPSPSGGGAALSRSPPCNGRPLLPPPGPDRPIPAHSWGSS